MRFDCDLLASAFLYKAEYEYEICLKNDIGTSSQWQHSETLQKYNVALLPPQKKAAPRKASCKSECRNMASL